MNAECLLAHYEQIADSPDAIARLRRFILDLAVRGKLVPQEPGDETAQELLNRIAKEKARLVKAGEFREPSSFVRIDRKALPFTPASHWVWARLIEIARPSYGFAFASGKFNSAKRGMPLIRIRDISNTDAEAYFEGDYDPAYLVTAGDYLVGMDGDFNLRRWRGIDGLLNQRVMRINGWRCGVDPEFVRLPLQFILDHLHGQTSLTTVKHLSAKQVNGIEIPLPPLAEQRRIVAKVDELMGLCDRLATARARREGLRDRLAAASLARLSTPDPDTFQADARFALDALPALTTRPDQIKALRQTILNLAVRGKLVPQELNDEPAKELLNRIFALPWTKKRKPSDLAPDNDALADAFPLPGGWEWASVDALVRPNETVTYGILKPEWVSDGVPTVRVTEMKTGIIDVSSLPKCDPKRAAKFQKTTLAPGDLLVSKDGTIGKTAFVPPELAGGNITQHMLRFPICDLVNSQYVRLTIDAPFCQAWLSGETKGVALQGVNVGDFRRMPIPLPPLAEQHRIIAKVDTLMALCDRLEANLTGTAATRRRLLDALLAEALAPAEDRELEAAE
ncbi:restriction endonuclease subunit S [Mesorhizobium wenxiniae]|uniref:Type I restriction modification DNA specificity domain-containing protein n=1 Tax=Mesorhizobium wenxiniae TaxID=2014805 RepID=A0A271K7R6_9HYPH|nr:restriction endonuclease subunit S [Mesorhizobium wenxiniae]PAP91791.1 hypothetical protein CIT31_31735 [Mesorhizobium wenxiniae]